MLWKLGSFRARSEMLCPSHFSAYAIFSFWKKKNRVQIFLFSLLRSRVNPFFFFQIRDLEWNWGFGFRFEKRNGLDTRIQSVRLFDSERKAYVLLYPKELGRWMKIFSHWGFWRWTLSSSVGTNSSSWELERRKRRGYHGI